MERLSAADTDSQSQIQCSSNNVPGSSNAVMTILKKCQSDLVVSMVPQRTFTPHIQQSIPVIQIEKIAPSALVEQTLNSDAPLSYMEENYSPYVESDQLMFGQSERENLNQQILTVNTNTNQQVLTADDAPSFEINQFMDPVLVKIKEITEAVNGALAEVKREVADLKDIVKLFMETTSKETSTVNAKLDSLNENHVNLPELPIQQILNV